ncbi:MAG: CBS domain-containing protein [Chloroflexi bacterium]|nr:CBS domain-containing protein [Chloroflexota bacterium]
MHTIQRVLAAKGRTVWATTPESTVYAAIQMMAEKDIGALLVLSEGQLVGIFSERDYARKVILKGKSSRELKVGDIMTYKVTYATPSQTVEECLAIMNAEHIRHLPVLEDGQLIGIVTIGDLVKAVISEQKDLIHHLEKHILENTGITR